MNITKLPSGSYRIRETVNGVTYSKTVKFKPKKYEAEQIIADMVGTGETSISYMTVGDAMSRYIAAKKNTLSPATIRCYVSYEKQFSQKFKSTLLSELTDEKVQLEINRFAKDKSAKYVKNLSAFILPAIKMFRKKLVIDITLPKGGQKRKAHDPVDKEIEMLIEKIHESKYEIPIELAIMGLRRSEICGLSIDDIGDGKLTIHNVKVQGADGKWVLRDCNKNGMPYRIVDIPKSLEEKIRKQGYIYKGHPGNIYKNLSKLLKKLGIEHFPLHQLRHYYASLSHALKVPDEYIMHNGGWKTDSVLKKVYRHAQADKIEELGSPVKQHFEDLFS